eukprot:123591-Rhodomonas_salina.1
MEEEPAPRAVPEKRVFGIDCNDLAANCWMVQEGQLSRLVDTSPQGTDGLIFGFAEEMRGVASIPQATFKHMMAVMGILYSENEESD